MPEEKTFKQELKISSDQLVGTVKKLVREANVRHLVNQRYEPQSKLWKHDFAASCGELNPQPSRPPKQTQRRIKNEKGDTLMEIPVTVASVGAPYYCRF